MYCGIFYVEISSSAMKFSQQLSLDKKYLWSSVEIMTYKFDYP